MRNLILPTIAVLLLIGFHIITVQQNTERDKMIQATKDLQETIIKLREQLTQFGISYCNLTKQCKQLPDGRIQLP